MHKRIAELRSRYKKPSAKKKVLQNMAILFVILVIAIGGILVVLNSSGMGFVGKASGNSCPQTLEQKRAPCQEMLDKCNNGEDFCTAAKICFDQFLDYAVICQ